MVNDAVIQRFWKWFGEQSAFLSSLHESGQMNRLATLVNEQIDEIDPQLAWEIGPGKNHANSFTISGEGDRRLGLLAEGVIAAAPKLNNWEFYASRQAREAPGTIRLPGRELELSTKDWAFSPIERPAEARIDLIIISSDLASVGRDGALRAVSIYLDEALGEETVEKWLGRFEVVADPPEGKKKFPLSEIADYVLWATHREKDPIRPPP